jgi:eukaryotic-like serine/threonine-protein kinase
VVQGQLSQEEITHGTRIGRFVVVGELGRGGMSVVYAAHDRELDRKVALKVLRGEDANEEERMRLLREGQAMARITHPNVIVVYEVGVERGLVFLAQELLDGGTLREWLESKKRSQPAILDKFVAAGRGLSAAHAAGLVHRDFKPDNVLLGKDGRVRVSDFGLARPLETEGLPAATRANMARANLELAHSPMSPLTRTGAVMGTPMFMAPEQHNGERADERSDQFAFCVGLYQALHGDWPFAGKTAVALADAVIEGRIQKPPKGASVPARIRKILARGLRPHPDERYPSIDALLGDLTYVPKRRGKAIAIGAGVASLIGAAAVAGYVMRDRGSEGVPLKLPQVDFKPPAVDRPIEWLSSALERGQLDDAIEKSELAGGLQAQRAEPVQASIAWSVTTVALAMRGRLADARARLKDVDANKGKDPLALACADLAAAAVASAAGELKHALDKSRRCADALAPTKPALAAICFEIQGDAAANLGDFAMARKAYEQGKAVAAGDPSRVGSLDLALAEVDLCENNFDAATKTAEAVQASSAERRAEAPEARAWVVQARVQLEKAESQEALKMLDHVPPKIEPIVIKILHDINVGQTHALLGEVDDGLAQIDAAGAQATKLGYPGLVLEARLVRAETDDALSRPDAKKEIDSLVRDARAAGFGRIVHLAETVGRR